jgi:hypothetical protein
MVFCREPVTVILKKISDADIAMYDLNYTFVSESGGVGELSACQMFENGIRIGDYR